MREDGTRPYSVQLHVHGSFSEGLGSIDSHSYEARDVGAEVIWWSDHDFRITSYHHASGFDFESWQEPIDHGESWTSPSWVAYGRRPSGTGSKGLVRWNFPSDGSGIGEITADHADDGEKSLRVRAAAASTNFSKYLFAIDAARGLFKRPLASGVSLELSVLPEVSGPDAQAIVAVDLSEHSPREGLPLATYHLEYVLGEGSGEASRDGETYRIPLRVGPGRWNRVSLPVTRDAGKGFPWTRGEDNSLVAVKVGVATRRSARASVLFDRFRIVQMISGPSAYRKQSEVIAGVAGDYPSLVELQGIEVSYSSQHLNEFSVQTEPLDYDAVLAEIASAGANETGPQAMREQIARRAVSRAHARGGLVSYNHMYGAGMEGFESKWTKEEMLARLLQNRLFGADLLEVGYRDRGGHSLDDHLWIWDQLATRGLFPVGVGVSDSHGGPDQRWRTNANNFLSWIYARSPSKPDLIEGMRGGRLFFGDIVLFNGAIDLETERGFRMGQLVLTDRERTDVSISVDGLQPGDSLRVIEGGALVETIPVSGTDVLAHHTLRLNSNDPSTLRVEAYGADARVKVLSNPIAFIRRAPPGGIAAARAGIDVGGLVSRHIADFTIDRADTSRTAAAKTVSIHGRGESGAIDFDCSEFGRPETVEFIGLSGQWSYDADHRRLVLTSLIGLGEIRIRR